LLVEEALETATELLEREELATTTELEEDTTELRDEL
jgi:hypothetical protein